MKLHHITLASLCLSGGASVWLWTSIVFRFDYAPAWLAALSTIWLLSCIAGLFSEIVRRAEP